MTDATIELAVILILVGLGFIGGYAVHERKSRQRRRWYA